MGNSYMARLCSYIVRGAGYHHSNGKSKVHGKEPVLWGIKQTLASNKCNDHNARNNAEEELWDGNTAESGIPGFRENLEP